MSLSLRACAALLLPFVLASGNAFAYSQMRCRDGSVRKTCCCTKKSAQAPSGPTLSRSCCVVETVQVERAPGSSLRRAPDFSAPAFSFVVAQRPSPDPIFPPGQFARHLPLRDAGPPILLKTCTLQV
ncbi:MAG TPA: hypothetical protein VGK67_16120 [Myxococcales bacterium]|jgi:hypothetical protein